MRVRCLFEGLGFSGGQPLRRLAVSAILIAYASARILSDRAFRRNQTVEPSLCRSGICGNGFLLEVAQQQLWQGGPGGAQVAAANFRKALKRDPASPHRWCDLGEALLESGETPAALHAIY